MKRITVGAVAVALATLTACSSGGDSTLPLESTEGASTPLVESGADVESSTEPLDEEVAAPEPPAGVPDAATIDELMTADVMEVDAIYAQHVRDEHPDQTADLSDDAITTIGHDACLAFGEGATVDDVMDDTIAAGVGAETGAYIVGGGLAVYFPEHLGMLGLE